MALARPCADFASERRTVRARRVELGVRGDALEVRAHERVVLRIVEQERVVAVRRVDLRVGDVAAVVDQRLDDLARARGGKRQSVVNETTRNLHVAGASACARSPPVARRRIEVVERLGDAQVRVRVVVLGELLALVAQVRFDLELGRERELEAVAQLRGRTSPPSARRTGR